MPLDITGAWSRWLLIDMDRQLAAATSAGLPIDPLALAVAHVLHGTELVIHAAGLPRSVVAEWLSMLAASVERERKILPILVWEADAEDDDAAWHA